MSLTAILCIVISLVATGITLRRPGRRHPFARVLVAILVASGIFAIVFAPGNQDASRRRAASGARAEQRAEARANRRDESPLRGRRPNRVTHEVPAPPSTPSPVDYGDSLVIRARTYEEPIGDVDKHDRMFPDPSDADPSPPDEATDEGQAHDLWSENSLPARVTGIVERLVERSLSLAERTAVQAEGFGRRLEAIQNGGVDALASAECDDAAAANDAAWQVAEQPSGMELVLPRLERTSPRRNSGMLVTIFVSGALLYFGYLFLDANTRGQFTWSLRIASVFAFAGLIAAVISLT